MIIINDMHGLRSAQRSSLADVFAHIMNYDNVDIRENSDWGFQ